MMRRLPEIKFNFLQEIALGVRNGGLVWMGLGGRCNGWLDVIK